MPGQVMVFKAKVIQPGPFRDNQLRQRVRDALDRVETTVRQAFEGTVQEWEQKPHFDRMQSTAGGIALVSVWTDDPLYYLIDRGAEEHTITAKNFPTLVWQRDYTSKTEPGVLSSRPSHSSGPWRREVSVDHPGFAARGYEEAIHDLLENGWGRRTFEEEMQQALDEFARRSGHHMP